MKRLWREIGACSWISTWSPTLNWFVASCALKRFRERTYFPYTSPWRQAFRIRFPRSTEGKLTVADNAKWFGLRFAGAEGNQELRWEVTRGEEKTAVASAP